MVKDRNSTKLPDITKGEREVKLADKVTTLLPSPIAILEVKLGKFLTGIALNYLISPKGKEKVKFALRNSALKLPEIRRWIPKI